MTVHTIPFVGNFNPRGIIPAFTTYDQLFQNIWFIEVKNELTRSRKVYLEKRPGFRDSGSVASDLTSINAMFMWLAGNSGTNQLVTAGIGGGVVRISGSAIYKSHADATFPINFINQTTNSAGTSFLVWQRTNAEVWGFPDGGAAAQITAAPANNVGPIQFMDGWSFIAKMRNPAAIYNSNLNDPTTGYTSYISCDKSGDILVACLKYKDYIIGAGQRGMEFFQNRGNATGSPLSRTSLYLNVGLLNSDAVAFGSEAMWFVSQGEGGICAVYKFDGQLTRISTTFIERILISKQNMALRFISYLGVQFLLVVDKTAADALVYFPDTGLWSYWLSPGSVLFETVCAVSGGAATFYAGATGTNKLLIFGTTASVAANYLDNGSSTTRIIRTSVLNFGTMNRKFEKSLGIIGDQQTSQSLIATSHTDDDYATNSTAVNIDMSSISPRRFRGGSFRKRAYTMTDTIDGPCRVEGMEVELMDGST